jgi:diguanylate cyclase (GGDEF)-like protein
MSLLSWFDTRTLYSCQLLLAGSFAAAFFGLRRSHPDVQGIVPIAFSFLAGATGILLLFLRGTIPDFVSMTVATALVLASYVLQYSAILRFLGVKRSFSPLLAADAIAMIVVFYFSQIQHNIVLRILASSLAIAFARGLIAVELFKHSRGRTHRHVFANIMTTFAILSCSRAVISCLYHAPSNYIRSGFFQTIAMAGDLVYICLLGLLFYTMVNSEIIALMRAESEIDPLSGIFNRRGIELKLELELKRIARGRHHLSIGLVDIDYFKSINDTAGHAAGDNALRNVVTAISAKLRAYDILGRFGGDEFLLILPQTPIVGGLIVAERIGEAVRSLPSTYQGRPLTLSIGLTEAIPGDYSTSLLSRADKALYRAKHAGRNCTRIVLATKEDEADDTLEPPVNSLRSSRETDLIRS